MFGLLKESSKMSVVLFFLVQKYVIQIGLLGLSELNQTFPFSQDSQLNVLPFPTDYKMSKAGRCLKGIGRKADGEEPNQKDRGGILMTRAPNVFDMMND